MSPIISTFQVLNTWTYANIISIGEGAALFVLGFYLQRKQKKLMREVHSLQHAFAVLEPREKIGVIHMHAEEVRRNKQPAVHTLIHDSSAVLPLYRWTDSRLKADYENSLFQAYQALSDTSDRNAWALDHLTHTLLSFSEELSQQHLEQLSASITRVVIKGAEYAYDSGKKKDALQICRQLARNRGCSSLFQF